MRFKKNKRLANRRRFLLEAMMDKNGMELQEGDEVLYEGEMYEIASDRADEEGMVEIQRNSPDGRSREITQAPLDQLTYQA